MTPSTMPARIASMRARSRACSASRRPTSCTDSIERARDRAELVVAEAEPRRREVAARGSAAPPARSAARAGRCEPKTARQWRPRRPARARARSAVAVEHRLQLMADVGQRQRRRGRTRWSDVAPERRRTACRSSRVALERRDRPSPLARASTTSGRWAWFSIDARLRQLLERIADDPSVLAR